MPVIKERALKVRPEPAAQEFRQTPPVAGRDAALPEWLGAEGNQTPVHAKPQYDSVVVLGGGIGALSVAARLARSPAFEGRVVIAGKPPEQNRRLIGGLTLRARSLDYFAACLGVPRQSILKRLYDGQEAEARSNRQIAARFSRARDGSYEIGPTGEWMTRWDHNGRALAYGVRNSHLAGILHDFSQSLAITWSDAKPRSLGDCVDLAPGKRPFVIKAEPMPLPGAGPVPTAPARFVAAAQLPFSAPYRVAKGVLPANTSIALARRRAGSMDGSVFYPLRDPLSPTARYYGIFYRIVKGGGALHRNAEIEIMKENFFGAAKAMGLEAVDPAETLGTALIPSSDWRPVNDLTPGFLDLNALANNGSPIICSVDRRR